MGKTGYLYPAWLQAKRKLYEALRDRHPNEDISWVLERWFRAHVYPSECGCQLMTDDEFANLEHADQP